MADPSIAFATGFDRAFRRGTAGLSHAEVPLFRSMKRALIALSRRFAVEEYHGGAHQVSFSGDSIYARASARCELSDLMLLGYSLRSGDVRVTYLQAKSERVTSVAVCGRRLLVKPEQWFLLAKRPAIRGLGRFSPPPDLLSGALLPSVGSFAFFYRHPGGHFETYYASADYLSAPQRRRVQALGPCQVRRTTVYDECAAVCGNAGFALALYRLQVGTPLLPGSTTATWIASTLRAATAVQGTPQRAHSLRDELIELLGGGVRDGGPPGAKAIILIRSEYAVQ